MKIENYTIIKFEKVSSTMDLARNFLDKDENFIIWAAEQTEGRGRYGRKWISPKGGLYFSLIVRKNDISDFLSEIITLSLIKTLYDFGIKGCKIDFPNDIIIKGKKISGVLIERSGDFYIIGIGINVEKNPNFEKYGYITMEDITGRKIDIKEVLTSFIKNFENTFKLFKNNIESGLKIWSENLLK